MVERAHLQALVGRHDPVPEVPREEIWLAVRTERATRPPAPRREEMWTAIRRRRAARSRRWAYAAAAALVLAAGLGVVGAPRGGPPEVPARLAPVAALPLPAPAAEPAPPADPSPAVVGSAPASTAPVPAAAPPPAPAPVAEGPQGTVAAVDPLVADLYGIVLAEAEALLAELARGPGPGALPGDVPGRARRLLRETWLVMDARAPGAAVDRLLLEDLELVLAQVAALPAGGNGIELRLVVEALDARALLPRIRGEIPWVLALTE